MYLYRYVDGWFQFPIEEEIYKVIKITPQGYWIQKLYDFDEFGDLLIGKKKWISKNTYNHRKFAYEDREEAMRNYRFRKATQIRILQDRLENAEKCYKEACEKDVTYEPEDEEFGSRDMYHRKNAMMKRRKKEKEQHSFLSEEEMMI